MMPDQEGFQEGDLLRWMDGVRQEMFVLCVELTRDDDGRPSWCIVYPQRPTSLFRYSTEYIGRFARLLSPMAEASG